MIVFALNIDFLDIESSQQQAQQVQQQQQQQQPATSASL